MLLNNFVIQKLSTECKSGMHPFFQYCASIVICSRGFHVFTAFTEAGVCFVETHRQVWPLCEISGTVMRERGALLIP